MTISRLHPSSFACVACLGAAVLLGSCEESTSSTEPTGSTALTYEASIPGLPGSWAHPDSLVWSIDGVVSQARLDVGDREVLATASLASAPTDTIDIALFASRLQLGSWHFRYRGATQLAYVGMQLEPVTVELLRRAGKGASPESLRAVLVKALLARDTFFVAHPYAKNIPAGLDTAAVVREFAIRAAASGHSFAQIASLPILPVDTVTLRKLIRSLASSGDIKDTTSLFPPPAKPRDTTVTPGDTTKPRDTTVTPGDTTKPRDTTVTPGDTTKPRDTTVTPGDTTKPITKDTDSPHIERLSFPLQVPNDSSSITVGWFATDDRGLKTVRINDDTLRLGQNVFKRSVSLRVGKNPVVFVATDSAGNRAWDSIVIVRADADTSAPILQRVRPAKDTMVEFDTTHLDVAWIVRDERRLGKVAINGTGIRLTVETASLRVPLALGRNVVSIVATDSAGNVSRDSIVVTRKADAIPPVLTRMMVHKGDSIVSPDVMVINMYWGAADNDSISKVTINDSVARSSGVGNRRVFESGTIPLDYGRNRFVIVATDVSGNVSTDTVFVTRPKDTLPPVLTRNLGTTDTTVPYAVMSFPVAWKVTDQHGTPKVTVNDSIITYGSSRVYARTLSLAVGVNRIVLVATDNYGNISTDTIRVVRKADDVPPVLTRVMVHSGDSIVAYGTKVIKMVWKVTDGDIISKVTINDSVAIPSDDNKSFFGTRTAFQLVDGPNRFVIVATDVSGNASTDTVFVTRPKDNLPPVLTRSSGTKDTTVASEVTSFSASWRVTDNTGLDSVAVNGYAVKPVSSVCTQTIPLVPGENRIVIVATDFYGNVSRDTVVVTRSSASEASRSVSPSLDGVLASTPSAELRTSALRSCQLRRQATISVLSAPVLGKDS